jgi:acetolactate synthase-1/2/3 large subunit
MAGVQLTGLEHLILVDAKSPVSFFAYPGKKSDLVPEGCPSTPCAAFGQDPVRQPGNWCRAGRAQARRRCRPRGAPARPRGRLTAPKVCKAVGHLLPSTPSWSTRPSPRA